MPRSGSRVRVPSRALHKSEYHLYARVAQLVEHDLAKVGVAGSSPVSRSSQKVNIIFIMREWLSWWSTTLPRSGSRVRVPSRALLNIERGYPLGYPLSILNESCRTRTGSYLRFGRRKANVHRTLCAPSRTCLLPARLEHSRSTLRSGRRSSTYASNVRTMLPQPSANFSHIICHFSAMVFLFCSHLIK